MSTKAVVATSNVSPRERAAHIACAVVLSLVVLGVGVSLIVYFTMDPKPSSDCSGNPIVAADKRDATPPPRRVNKAAPKPVRNVQRVAADVVDASASPLAGKSPVSTPSGGLAPTQPAPTLAGPTVADASSAAAPGTFASTSPVTEVVTTQNAQGLTTMRSQQYTDQLQTFNTQFQQAFASQNPLMAQQMEMRPLHNNPNLVVRGELAPQYQDTQIFNSALQAWRQTPIVQFNQTEAYMQHMQSGPGQYAVGNKPVTE